MGDRVKLRTKAAELVVAQRADKRGAPRARRRHAAKAGGGTTA